MKEGIRLEALTKSVGGRVLLDLPRFDIAAFSCTVLTGRNGSGKTTLLKIVAGLEPPDMARVVLDGRAFSWSSARSLLRRRSVYLHQHPVMFDRTVWDNVAYGLRLRGDSSGRISALVDDALQWAGLEHLARRHARLLSGGEKQRVALVRARVLEPEILLLDEPLVGMDRDSRQQTLELILRLSTEGRGVVVTSHEPDVTDLVHGRHFHL